jgi:iron complex transport system substrate-binding protein
VPQPWQQATIYLEADPSGYVAGPGSYLGQLVQALGLRNVVRVREPAYPLMSPEWVLQARPDWVVLLSTLSRPANQRPGWQQLEAVRAGRVCQFAPEDLDVLVRPGPRLAQAAQLLVGCMNAVGRP